MIESVDIKDISGNIRFSTPINEGSKRKFLLMKEDYITLKFSLDNPIYFQLGDGIDNELGIFELVDLCKPTYNTTTGGYDYELRLDAYYWKWKNKKFFYTPQTTGREASWNLTAPLHKHLEVFLDNLKALGYKFRAEEFTPEIDNTVENASKLVSYDNVNLIDALTQMAETWECEWWIENHRIRFGRCEFSSPVDFKLGDLLDTENVNVNSMQRSDSQTKYATRVYAFGSTRNIPDSYRKSLIFDVKEVKGRDISDTERSLDIKFFPINVTHKEQYSASDSEQLSGLDRNVLEWSRSRSLSYEAKSGVYQITSEGITAIVKSYIVRGMNFTSIQLPRGNYVCNARFTYRINGVQKEIHLGSQTIVVGDDSTYNVQATFDVPDRIEIEKETTELRLEVYGSVPSPWIPESKIFPSADYQIKMASAPCADISVTFLSGLNEGKTFDAIYNPDLLTGDAANVLRLPEGITASLGDRYIINNIIKGKVPDNYFSKDDKELTLNGVVQKRLMLPDGIPYIDAYKYSPAGERIDIGDERYDNPDNIEMPIIEAIEEIVVFEDEYPKYIGSTVEVPKPRMEKELDEDGNPTENEYPVYSFKDTELKNFTKYFRLKGKELRLVFQTGKLSGLDFALDLKESDNTGTTFEIIPNKDYGRLLPDDALFPQTDHTEDGKPVPADTYILHGFDTAYISEQMLPKSEQDLLKRAQKFVKKSMIDPSTYDCEMDCGYIYNEGNIRTFEAGDKVNLINKAYFPDGRQSRIIGFEWPLDIPYDHPIYTIGETAAYSRIGEIESKLDSMTYKGQTYGGSVVGGGGTSVYVIGVNDKTLPSDRNTFSAKRVINEIEERSISRTKDDKAAGHIDFEKGLTSKELIEANNGLVVRRSEVVEPVIISLLSSGFEDSLVEENADAFIEELRSSSGNSSTLGELDNVAAEADSVSATSDLLVRPAGSLEWTLNTTLISQVSALMAKVFPFTTSLSGGGVYEKGSVQTINLSWTYDRDIMSQSINGETLDIGVRAKQYTDVTSDTTYNLSAIYEGHTYSKSTSVEFRLKKYYGVSAQETLINEDILALNSLWATRAQSSTVFDCTGGKYPYYILPASLASGIQFWIGGLRNSDWTEEVRDVTNAYGYTESYTIFRLNRIQTGVLNIEVK